MPFPELSTEKLAQAREQAKVKAAARVMAEQAAKAKAKAKKDKELTDQLQYFRSVLSKAGGSGKPPLQIHNPDNPLEGLSDEQIHNLAETLSMKYHAYPTENKTPDREIVEKSIIREKGHQEYLREAIEFKHFVPYPILGAKYKGLVADHPEAEELYAMVRAHKAMGLLGSLMAAQNYVKQIYSRDWFLPNLLRKIPDPTAEQKKQALGVISRLNQKLMQTEMMSRSYLAQTQSQINEVLKDPRLSFNKLYTDILEQATLESGRVATVASLREIINVTKGSKDEKTEEQTLKIFSEMIKAMREREPNPAAGSDFVKPRAKNLNLPVLAKFVTEYINSNNNPASLRAAIEKYTSAVQADESKKRGAAVEMYKAWDNWWASNAGQSFAWKTAHQPYKAYFRGTDMNYLRFLQPYEDFTPMLEDITRQVTGGINIFNPKNDIDVFQNFLDEAVERSRRALPLSDETLAKNINGIHADLIHLVLGKKAKRSELLKKEISEIVGPIPLDVPDEDLFADDLSWYDTMPLDLKKRRYPPHDWSTPFQKFSAEALATGNKKLALFLLLNYPEADEIENHFRVYMKDNPDPVISKHDALRNGLRRRLIAKIAEGFLNQKLEAEVKAAPPELQAQLAGLREEYKKRVVQMDMLRKEPNPFRPPHFRKVHDVTNIDSGYVQNELYSVAFDNAKIKLALVYPEGREFMAAGLADLERQMRSGELNERYGLPLYYVPPVTSEGAAKVQETESALLDSPLAEVPYNPATQIRVKVPVKAKVKHKLEVMPTEGGVSLARIGQNPDMVTLYNLSVVVPRSTIDISRSLSKIMEDPLIHNRLTAPFAVGHRDPFEERWGKKIRGLYE
jgi:hypothetical protein